MYRRTIKQMTAMKAKGSGQNISATKKKKNMSYPTKLSLKQWWHKDISKRKKKKRLQEYIAKRLAL